MNQPTPSPQFTPEMQDLQQAYLKRLAANLSELRRFQELFTAQRATTADIQQFYRLSHNFAGSGATFGYPEISEKARAFHRALGAYNEAPDHSEASPGHAQVVQTLAAFIEICRELIVSKPAETAATPLAPTPMAAHVLCYAEDGEAAGPLLEALREAGLPLQTTADPATLLRHASPSLWVGDLSKRQVERLLPMLPADKNNLPLVVVGPQDHFDTRLAAARLGAKSFFTADINPAVLAARLRQLMQKPDDSPYRVLLVDDDDMLADFYSHALKAAGMQVSVAASPKLAFKLLKDGNFDLALLDYMLPHCTGPELAAMIRLDEHYAHIPVIFMSARENSESMQWSAGLAGDDFLVKPFTPEQLVALALLRAQRTRELATRFGIAALSKL